MLRGISGGQKKRVITGEMLVGPAKALFMDEISTGLDSSTTFQIVKSLRQYVHILKGTAFISFLQPAPETYDLFDDIILLSDNQIVYQGPREQVTSKKDQQQYWACYDEPYRFVTVRELSEAFKSFHIGQRLADELVVPFDKTKSHPAALTTKTYGVSKKEILKASASREVLLMKRNSFVYIFQLMQLAILAFVAMTVFLRTEMHRNSVADGGIYLGAIFFSVEMILFNGISEIFMTVWKLPIFYKQRDLLFYPACAYAIPSWILKVPFSCIEVALWIFLTMSLDVIQMWGVNVKKWSIWVYWISPAMNAQNAILVHEFLGANWRNVPPNASEPLGVLVLKSRGLFADAYWYWLGVGALVVFIFIFNVWYTLALTFLSSLGKPQAFIGDDNETTECDGEASSSIRRTHSEERKKKIQQTFSPDQSRKRGMVLPFEQHSIAFDEIVYSVDMPQVTKSNDLTIHVPRCFGSCIYALLDWYRDSKHCLLKLSLKQTKAAFFEAVTVTVLLGKRKLSYI